jgi:hypothetical protein
MNSLPLLKELVAVGVNLADGWTDCKEYSTKYVRAGSTGHLMLVKGPCG